MKTEILVVLIKKITFALALALIGLISTSCSHKERDALVPDNWTPSLEQAGEFVDEMSKNQSLINQRFLSDTSQHLADISDARLFIVYVRLMQTLNNKERGALFDEQQQWLEKREQSARAAVISKGGSLAPVEYNHVFRSMTEARLSELLKQFNKAQIITNPKEEKSHEPD